MADQLPNTVTDALREMHRGEAMGQRTVACCAAGVALEAAIDDRLHDALRRRQGTDAGRRLYDALGDARHRTGGADGRLALGALIRLAREHLSLDIHGRPADFDRALEVVRRARNAAVHAERDTHETVVPLREVVDSTWFAVGALYKMGRDARRTLRGHIDGASRSEPIVPTPRRRRSRASAVVFGVILVLVAGLGVGIVGGHIPTPFDPSAPNLLTEVDEGLDRLEPHDETTGRSLAAGTAATDSTDSAATAPETPTGEPTASDSLDADAPTAAPPTNAVEGTPLSGPDGLDARTGSNPCAAWRNGDAGKDDAPHLSAAVWAYCDAIDAFNDMEGGVYMAAFAAPLLWYDRGAPLTRAQLRAERGARFEDAQRYSRYVIDDLRIISTLSDHDTVVLFEEGRLLQHTGGCRTHNKAIRLRHSGEALAGWVIDAEVSAFQHAAWPAPYEATSRFLTTHTGTIADTCSGLEWWAGPFGEEPPESTCGGDEGWHDDSGDSIALTRWRVPNTEELATLSPAVCERFGGSPPAVDTIRDADGAVRRLDTIDDALTTTPTHTLRVRRARPEGPRIQLALPAQTNPVDAPATLGAAVLAPTPVGIAPPQATTEEPRERRANAPGRLRPITAPPMSNSVTPVLPVATPMLRVPSPSNEP